MSKPILLSLLVLLLVLLNLATAFDSSTLSPNLGCGIHFPLNNYTRYALLSTPEMHTASSYVLGYEAYSGPQK